MRKSLYAALIAAPLLSAMLTGCGGLPPVTAQPADPKVTQKIVTACTDSGLFKLADGALAFAVPAASLPVSVLNAGVDKVCANPAAFAGDVSTAEWVAKNTLAAAKTL